MNQENTNNKTIKIIVGAVILVGLVIFFSKDSIMYGYYVNKGDKEVESWKAVQDYTDALKIKYDDLLVDKIKLNVLQSDEYATSLLEDLDGVLKSSDLNQLYVDVYVKEATNAYKEGDYKLCEKELDKAVFYGYYKNDFKYIDELESYNKTNSSSNNNTNKVVRNNSNSYYNYNSNEYIIPDSDSRYLTRSELSRYTKTDLGYIRNEIFVRYGYVFSKAKYRNYFGAKSWYYPDPTVPDDESILNNVERANVHLIKSME